MTCFWRLCWLISFRIAEAMVERTARTLVAMSMPRINQTAVENEAMAGASTSPGGDLRPAEIGGGL